MKRRVRSPAMGAGSPAASRPGPAEPSPVRKRNWGVPSRSPRAGRWGCAGRGPPNSQPLPGGASRPRRLRWPMCDRRPGTAPRPPRQLRSRSGLPAGTARTPRFACGWSRDARPETLLGWVGQNWVLTAHTGWERRFTGGTRSLSTRFHEKLALWSAPQPRSRWEASAGQPGLLRSLRRARPGLLQPSCQQPWHPCFLTMENNFQTRKFSHIEPTEVTGQPQLFLLSKMI